jgi:hypothetical protein
MLNVLQRVGGSLGVAIFTVILENGIEDRQARGVGPASAFAHTYAWAVAAALLALIPALILRREEARARRAGKADQPRPEPMAA